MRKSANPLISKVMLTLAIAILATGSVCGQDDSSAGVDAEARRTELELRQLELEVAELELGNQWGTALKLAPFLTTLAAVLGVSVGAWKFLREQSRQRDLDRAQEKSDRKQRLDERFGSIVENIGEESPAMRSGAAVLIHAFLKPEHTDYHERIFYLLVAMLRIEKQPAVLNLLQDAFEVSLRLRTQAVARTNEEITDKHQKIVLDLSGCDMSKTNLQGIDLKWANVRNGSLADSNLSHSYLNRLLGESTKFERVRATGADLRKARLNQAVMVDANLRASDLRWAHMKGADLTRCKLQRALLQSAHLENAVLEGCRFERADVNSAFFFGASFDGVSKSSIVKACNWRKAHFDPALLKELVWIESKLREQKSALRDKREQEA